MRKVSIFGGKTSEFRKETEISVSHIALESTVTLLKETGFPRSLIDGRPHPFVYPKRKLQKL